MLNACPKCQRLFPDGAVTHCPDDGTAVVPLAEAPAPRDPSDPIVGHAMADRFEVRRVVADGAMGRVYEAHERGAEKRVAVKVLHAQVAEEAVNIERFRREASTSKELAHEHIVDVINFESVPGVPGRSKRTWYLAMEFLDGEELSALLKREKSTSIARAVRVASQIALALDYAHARGFVHRDIKPDNVFLVRRGGELFVKLLDFGSVKFTKGQDRGNKLTVLGTTIGSPYYMSPEQAQGLPDLDHRADVWAVAVILYEMTVGRVPFNASNGPQILFKILSDEPQPPTFVNEALPEALDDVLLRGLKKSPADRFQSVGDLADALGHAFGLEGSHRDWATTPEADLERAMAAAKPAPEPAPEPPAPPPEPPTPDVASVVARAEALSATEEPARKLPDPDDGPAPVLPPALPVPAWVLATGAVVLVVAVIAYFVAAG